MLKLTVHVNPSDVRRAKDAFKAVGDTADEALGAALYAEANRALNMSRPLVPVDTGVLRGSGVVLQPQRSGSGVRVVMGYGGAAKAYALKQHEELSYRHRVGQAKYLVEGVRRSLPGAEQRIAANIRKRLGK